MSKKTPLATHQGVVDIAGFKIRCYNLDTGERVLSREGFLRALGRTGKPKYKEDQSSVDETAVFTAPLFLRANNLKEFISSELIESSKHIEFEMVGGQKAYGYKADILPLVCYVYIDAEKKGVLTPRQTTYAERSHSLIRGFATIGIIALVDEATGFQETRQRDALQKILDKYLRKEYAAWARCFPMEFYEELFRLKGWPLDKTTMKMPGVVGRYTNDFIYDRLAPGILEELRKRNPVIEEIGRRQAKHHQWLTQETGHPALDKHFSGVLALMRANTQWEVFKRGIERAYPKIGTQLALKFIEEEESENN